MSRKEWQRGFANIKKSKERVIIAAGKNKSRPSMRTNRTIITKKEKWERKQLNGYFKRQTGEISLKDMATLKKL